MARSYCITNRGEIQRHIAASASTDGSLASSFSFDIELLVDFEDHLCHFDCLASKQTRQFKLETISKSIRLATLTQTFSTYAEWTKNISELSQIKYESQRLISYLMNLLTEVSRIQEVLTCFLETKFLALKTDLSINDKLRVDILRNLIISWFDDKDTQNDLLETLSKS